MPLGNDQELYPPHRRYSTPRQRICPVGIFLYETQRLLTTMKVGALANHIWRVARLSREEAGTYAEAPGKRPSSKALRTLVDR